MPAASRELKAFTASLPRARRLGGARNKLASDGGKVAMTGSLLSTRCEPHRARHLAQGALAALVALAAPAAHADCWRLPDHCYAMELTSGEFSILMSGRRANRDVVTLATAGDDGAQDEFLCFSEVRADGIFCANYFLCKPRGDDPAHIDSASPDVLEIRWRERAAELPTTAEVRHHSETAAAALTSGQWHSLPVRFRHWYSIASGAPQCRVEMTKD